MAVARTMSVAASAPAPQHRPTAQANAQPQARVELARFEDLVALAHANRDIQLKTALERDVKLVRFERGAIEFSLAPGASPQLAQTLMRRLQEWTGIRWMVAVSREEGAATLKEQADARAEEKMTGLRALPLVRKALETFPGAQIVAIRGPEAEPEPVTAAIAPETADGGDEIGYADQIYTEDDL
jgi:DNA polymerase-3 subunit gamma/tau